MPLDLMTSLPDVLRRMAIINALKEVDRLSGGVCMEPAISEYLKAFPAKDQRGDAHLSAFLEGRSYTPLEIRELIRTPAGGMASAHLQYGLLGFAEQCIGENNAFRVVLSSANDAWLRLWNEKISEKDSVPLLIATMNAADHALSRQDLCYLAYRTAEMALSEIEESSMNDDALPETTYRGRVFPQMRRWARDYSRDGASSYTDQARYRAAAAIDAECARYFQGSTDREYEFDERMRNIYQENMRDDEGYLPDGVDPETDEVPLDLEALEVARLPRVDIQSRSSPWYSAAGPAYFDEEDTATGAYAMAAMAIANVVMWANNDQIGPYYEPVTRALSASVSAVILAEGRVRTIPSRRNGGNADRIFDPTKPCANILKLWRRIFPRPSLLEMAL